MSSNIVEYFEELNACITSSNFLKAKKISDDIFNAVICASNEDDITLLSSLMFNEQNGLLPFLQKTILLNNFTDAKYSILEGLLVFIKKAKDKVLNYAVAIKDICLDLLLRDKSTKIHSDSLLILIQLFEMYSGQEMANKLNIPSSAEKIFSQLSKAIKSSTVRQVLYHVIGTMSKSYPASMEKHSLKILNLLSSVLNQQMTSKNKRVEFAVIAGCLLGFDGFLFNFKDTVLKNEKKRKDIFNYVKNSFKSSLDISRYDMPKAGLLIISHHANLFSDLLYQEFQAIYEQLQFWAQHTNREIRQIAHEALKSFLRQVVDELNKQAQSETSGSGAVFKYFIQEFQKIINSGSNISQVKIAAFGFGIMAAPCKIFLTDHDVTIMFNEVLIKSEQIFFGETELIEDKIQVLPSFLEALANIIKELDKVPESMLSSAKKLIILLIGNFPLLSHVSYYASSNAIFFLLMTLSQKIDTFQTFISDLVYEAIIQTCSHPYVADNISKNERQLDDSINANSISYRNYLPFWNIVLNKFSYESTDDEEILRKNYLVVTLYDEIIICSLRILLKLNFSCDAEEKKNQDIEDSQNEVHSDPFYGLTAKNPVDFQIFMNLVEFSQKLTLVKHPQLFHKWFYRFSYQIINLSTKYPIVSGFYKLLTSILKLNFKENSINDFTNQDSFESSDLNSLFYLYMKFSKELMSRINLYKDELLVCCLEFMLSLPLKIVEKQMKDIIPILKKTFELGLSCNKLTIVGLEALEVWHRSLPDDVMRPFYGDILPCLDAYLHLSSSESKSSALMPKYRKKISRMIKKKTVSARKEHLEQLTPEQDSLLHQIRLRVVKLLGHLGHKINSSLIVSDSTHAQELTTALDFQKHLPFQVPFNEMKPVIHLDVFLPRMIELSCSSSNRQMKIAACELLHSTIIFMIGTDANNPRDLNAKSIHSFSMVKLFDRIFPAILQLSCDADQVTKQLFEPLTLQIIHWFTSKQKRDSLEVASLVQAILDGIANSTDASLRDFSAKCIQEYFIWSVKHAKRKENNQFHKLVQQLKNLCVHPNLYKRLSASITFNSIYKVFREQEDLVNNHILELLVSFIDGLALAHHDVSALGTENQFKQSIDHIEKIIRVKVSVLLKNVSSRVKPREFKEANLEECINWLIKQCGRLQTECRHKCMQLITKLAPLLPNVSSVEQFFKNILSTHRMQFLVNIFEGKNYCENGFGIGTIPTLSDISNDFTVEVTFQWFDMILAALDCYSWVLNQKLLPIEILAQGNFLRAVKYFISNIATKNFDEIQRVFINDASRMIPTPQDTIDFNGKKCYINIRIMNLLTVIIPNDDRTIEKALSTSFFGPVLWNLVINAVIQPSALGFNMNDIDVIDNLPKLTEELLKIFSKKMNTAKLNNFKAYLENFVRSGENSKYDLRSNLKQQLSSGRCDYIYFKCLFDGFEQLIRTGVLDADLQNRLQFGDLTDVIFEAISSNLKTHKDGVAYTVPLIPDLQMVLSSMFKLAQQLQFEDAKLLLLIQDETALTIKGTNDSIPFNKQLFHVLKKDISQQVNKNSSTFIPKMLQNISSSIINSLIAILAELRKDMALRKSTKVTDIILKCWTMLETWCEDLQDRKDLLIELLTHILIIDSKVVRDSTHFAFKQVFETYNKMLITKTSLNLKEKLFEILPFFCATEDIHLDTLKSNMEIMAHRHFPSFSKDFNPKNAEILRFKVIFSKLLSAMELSSSNMLLEFLANIVCCEDKHVCTDEFQISLIRFMKKIPRPKQKSTVDIPYKIFSSESNNISDILRRNIIDVVCVPLLENVSSYAFKEFFSDHIIEIVSFLQAIKIEDKRTTLLLNIGSCKLLEILYTRLSKNDLSSTSSQINQSYSCKVGRELTSSVSKLLHEIKKKRIKENDLFLQKLRRSFQCAAYNAFMAIIMKTQTELKFFKVFLFSENPSKGDFLWSNIIDLQKDYSFEMEFDEPLSKQKKFSSLINQIKELHNRREQNDESIHYITSQYLASSSLVEHTNPYDFLSTDETNISASNQNTAITNKGNDKDDVLEYAELEMDELNSHECMASLSTVLRHMKKIGLISEPDAKKNSLKMPEWMEEIHKIFCESSTHRNIKLFLCKLILNNQEIFHPYAKFWMLPMINILIQGYLGNYINYFVTDLVVTVLSWSDVAIPEDNKESRDGANNLLEFLMSNCNEKKKPILRNNLDLVKLTVENWKLRLDVPIKVIYNQLSSTDANSKQNTVGIQLLGIVLANDVPLHENLGSISFKDLWQRLIMNLNFKSKEIFGAVSEVIGLIFKQIHGKTQFAEEFSEFANDVEKNITLMESAQHNWDKMIICIHRIHKHFPEFSLRFIQKLLYRLPSLQGIYKSYCLEIILGNVDHIEDIYQELKNKDIFSLLKHKDGHSQCFSLMIIQKILPRLTPDQLNQLLTYIVPFTEDKSTDCRKAMIDLLMAIYDQYIVRVDDSDDIVELLATTKKTLLYSLCDSDMNIRLALLNYWGDEKKLSSAPDSRLAGLLNLTYSPGSEHNFLSYATTILMEMTSRNANYRSKIFNAPLSKCRFVDYQLSSSWSQRHSSFMTPLFSDSQSLDISSQGSLIEDYKLSAESSLALQSTQQKISEFSQTLETKKRPYNWLTEDSLLETGYAIGSLSEDLQSLSSTPMIFGMKSSKEVAKKFQPTVDNKELELHKLLKRRFLSDENKTKLHYAKRALRMQQREQEFESLKRAKRESQVTIYRSYRIGDLPDIEIPYSAVINPLQALAQKDETTARLLFFSLFDGIVKELEKDSASNPFMKKVSKFAACIFEESNQYNSNFISCMMEMCLKDVGIFKMNLDDLMLSVQMSTRFNLGILYLEESILSITNYDDETASPRSKRRKLLQDATDCMVEERWMRLAELYRSIGDYDISRQIFQHKIHSVDDQVIEALNAEELQDYSKALKIYENLLKANDCNETEMDMWYESMLKCCNSLTSWERLESYSLNRTSSNGDLDEFWVNPYAQDHYLPYFIRAKLKRLIEERTDQTLLSFIDKSMKIPESKSIIENRHCEELALLFVIQEDYDRAKFYASSCIQNFLQEWSSLNPLMISSRKDKLENLQKLTELMDFLRFIDDKSNLKCKDKITGLLDDWGRSDPGGNASVTAWDDIITNRALFIEKLDVCIKEEGLEEISEFLKGKILHSQLSFDLSYVKSMIKQKNIAVALRRLQRTKNDLKLLDRESPLKINWIHLYCQARQAFATTQANVNLKFETLLSAWHFLENSISLDEIALTSSALHKHYSLKSKYAERIADLICDESLQISLKSNERLCTILNEPISEDLIQQQLMKKSFDYLKTGCKAVGSSDSFDQASCAAINLKLSKFCKEYINSEENKRENHQGYLECLIESLLNAMCYGSDEAAVLFPWLIQIIEDHPSMSELFIEKCKRIPCWMFIRWINQLIAMLDKPEAFAVHSIVKRIALDYPQAIIYSFKLSSDGYKHDTSSIGLRNKEFCMELTKILGSSTLIENFVEALSLLTPPHVMFKEYMSEISKLLKEGDVDGAELKFSKLCDNLFVNEEDKTVHFSEFRQLITKKFCQSIKSKFGNRGEAMPKMSSLSFSKYTKEFFVQLNNTLKSGKQDLSYLSPWLSNFQMVRYNELLELPGQYDGRSKPMPEYHIKIAGFGPQYHILKSKQLPGCLIIRGNDEREYRFLIKAGEDLRQDNRIEQSFKLINDIFAKEIQRTQIKISTYQVIPLTTSLGMIEWVDDTMPLKEFFNMAFDKNDQDFDNILMKCNNECTKLVQKKVKNVSLTNPVLMYATMYAQLNREDSQETFEILKNIPSKYLLKKAFINMSSGPEAFIMMRRNFAVSYAALSVCSWILGIGDRHLSNFLISTKTGAIIGIDFGLAFGSATQDLPIPELIPFRMTPQILNLMEPMQDVGIIRVTMERALHAIRNNHDLLLNVLNVFIKEPKIDWQKSVKQKKKDMSSDEKEELTWFPKKMMERVRRKILGANPCHITKEELIDGRSHLKSFDFEKISQVCLGSKSTNVRAKLPKDGLTVEHQVSALIDQATDPNILLKSYFGLSTWI